MRVVRPASMAVTTPTPAAAIVSVDGNQSTSAGADVQDPVSLTDPRGADDGVGGGLEEGHIGALIPPNKGTLQSVVIGVRHKAPSSAINTKSIMAFIVGGRTTHLPTTPPMQPPLAP